MSMAMSTASPTPEEQTEQTATEQTANATATGTTRPQPQPQPQPRRVHACVLCQQRKVKCDRTFPCANCVRTGVQCISASLAPRRRRFPERELLERLRHYEDLLRQNNIKFEPLHTSDADAAAEHVSRSEDRRGSNSVDDAHPEGSREKTAVKSKAVYKARNLWHAISQIGFLYDNDDAREAVIKHAWDITYQSESNDHLLFSSPKPSAHLVALHPEQVQIFRLWQIYLENVNPLLKVTHTPTLQARIVDAARDMANISPTLEALIFSIYCVSVLSLAEDECCILFGSQRKDLLTSYQFACQQSLLNCRAWQSDDRDCLTALYLYLVSVRPETDPRSLSSMLAIAIRIAQGMGIHDESTYARYTALEAEMRRRLWWSLAIFDNRVCETLGYKTATLAPTCDCKTPLNVNDSEIRSEMKTSPAIHEKPTEALFAVVRSELGDVVRQSVFIDPSLNTVSKTKDTRHGPVLECGELIALEKTIEDKYLVFCDPENPLHFMTIWTTRGYLAKTRLSEHYSRYSTSSIRQTDTQRKAAISYALSMLECDTKLMTSPLTKGYLWLVHFDFPFLAYVHILQTLRKKATEDHAEKAWDAMSDNYEARVMDSKAGEPILIVFARVVLQAWEAREALLRQQDKPLEPPRIVSDIRNKLAQIRSKFLQHINTEQQNGAMAVNIDESPLFMPMDFGGYGTGGQYFTGSGPGGCPDIPGQAITDVDMNQFWTAIDWNWEHTQGW